MLTACDETNQNNIAWGLVEADDSFFTRCEAPRALHQLSGRIDRPSQDIGIAQTSEIDIEIGAGRHKKFDSIEDLIADLGTPGE